MLIPGRAVRTALGAAVLLLAGAGTPAPAVVITNSIRNVGTVGLGVIHVRDGNYVHGQYDSVLGEGRDSFFSFGWTTTAGWYTGPGYCTRQWRSDHPGEVYRRQLPDLGPGQHFIGSQTSYQVEAYRC